MDANGIFRQKAGFTTTPNGVIHDVRLSAKALGMYVKIDHFLRIPQEQRTFALTKTYLRRKFKEMNKAFDSTWNELKNAGYLKLYMFPQKTGKIPFWEYELLDEPKEGAHTFYHDKDGNCTYTNLTRPQNDK